VQQQGAHQCLLHHRHHLTEQLLQDRSTASAVKLSKSTVIAKVETRPVIPTPKIQFIATQVASEASRIFCCKEGQPQIRFIIATNMDNNGFSKIYALHLQSKRGGGGRKPMVVAKSKSKQTQFYLFISTTFRREWRQNPA
jgi:hypothetical protein